MSSERTGVQLGKWDEPQADSTGRFGHTGAYIEFRPKYQYQTEIEKTQVLDLKPSVTYLLVVLMSPPLSLERFYHFFQTRCPFFFFFFSPFYGSAPPLFLLSSFTQCPLFHIISYMFLFQYQGWQRARFGPGFCIPEPDPLAKTRDPNPTQLLIGFFFFSRAQTRPAHPRGPRLTAWAQIWPNHFFF